jgi:hypothetical protein
VARAVKVVVACAERHLARLVEANLRRQGKDAVIATDAKDALARAGTGTIDVLVLDPDLPGAEEVRRGIPPGVRLFELGHAGPDDGDPPDLPAALFLTRPGRGIER